jgi:hypothetical protein
MNIYHVNRLGKIDYDEYDSCVVIAPDAEIARRMIPPDGRMYFDSDSQNSFWGWEVPGKLVVNLIGTALPGETQRVVCASFNAG